MADNDNSVNRADTMADPLSASDAAPARYRRARLARWEFVAYDMEHRPGWGSYYHRRLAEIYQYLVAPGLRVLELGCGQGDLLAAVKPGTGVGVDFSATMLERAARRHPELRFVQADVHTLDLYETFDVIILSDLVNDLWDVQAVLQVAARRAHQFRQQRSTAG